MKPIPNIVDPKVASVDKSRRGKLMRGKFIRQRPEQHEVAFEQGQVAEDKAFEEKQVQTLQEDIKNSFSPLMEGSDASHSSIHAVPTGDVLLSQADTSLGSTLVTELSEQVTSYLADSQYASSEIFSATAGEAGSSVAFASSGAFVPLIAVGTAAVTGVFSSASAPLGTAHTATVTAITDNVGPTLISSTPGDNAIRFDPNADLTFTFSEPITLGSAGTITLKALEGAADVVIDVANHAGQLSVLGNTLTINPSSKLANSAYAVQISSGAVTDLSGNVYEGLTDTTSLSFTTSFPSVIDLGSAGNLVSPIVVEDKLYYLLDANKNGVIDPDLYLGAIPSPDRLNFDALKQLVLGHSADGEINDNNRVFTMNGFKLALPKIGVDEPPIAGQPYYKYATGTSVGAPTENNPQYDDFLAIWDAFNGNKDGDQAVAGCPSGWGFSDYWTANTSGASQPVIFLMNYGFFADAPSTSNSYGVVLQVL